MRRKEPIQKRCEWCNKWFPTVRDGRFCKDRCRSKWHRQKELDDNLAVYNKLREALSYCCGRYPELLSRVNEMLSSGPLPDSPIGLDDPPPDDEKA